MEVFIIVSNIGFILWLCVGYKIGKIKERREWNTLVEDGELPRPKNK